ncbi:MAG: PaaI family thioesterase [Bacteroidaceae bacterium]|nr:PaaI family thioesterase [Bacteroidaceae bacterium]
MKEIKDFLKNDRFAANAGVELIEVHEKYAKAQMRVTAEHLNAGGVCQGGALFTLADLAYAAVANNEKALTFSITANITFVHAAKEGEIIYAEAEEIVNHPRIPFIEVRLTNGQGELLAIFTSSGYRKKS